MELKRRNCKIIAHRGFSSQAPENTLPAFILASEKGYDGIECDIRVTKDNQIIVFHDDTLKRMTNSKKKVDQLTYDEIKKNTINAGNNVDKYTNVTIPLLDDFLIICKDNGLIPFIEIKQVQTQENLDDLVSLINQHGLLEKVSILAFNLDYLIYLREHYPNLTCQYLTHYIYDDVIELCKANRFDVGSNYLKVSEAQINACHKEGISVNVWTVDDFEVAQLFIDSGVDFLTTNTLR